MQVCPLWATEIDGIAPQPYFAAVSRALEMLAKLGSPVVAVDAEQIASLARQHDGVAVYATEKILDRYTITRVIVDAGGNARAYAGGAQPTLFERGWRLFTVRISNPTGTTAELDVASAFGTRGRMLPFSRSLAQRPYLMDTLNKAPVLEKMWLMSQTQDSTPPSGFIVEYRAIALYSRDRGKRRSYLGFGKREEGGPGSATGALLYRRGVALDFDCLPSRDVVLDFHDAEGRGCVASLTIKDKQDRVYPPQAMRIAPGMAFQPHIYREDGETVRLPEGEYTIESRRGPEYLHGMQMVMINEGHAAIDVKLKRWIDPGKWG